MEKRGVFTPLFLCHLVDHPEEFKRLSDMYLGMKSIHYTFAQDGYNQLLLNSPRTGM